jgi:hypothetical protein
MKINEKEEIEDLRKDPKFIKNMSKNFSLIILLNVAPIAINQIDDVFRVYKGALRVINNYIYETKKANSTNKENSRLHKITEKDTTWYFYNPKPVAE